MYRDAHIVAVAALVTLLLTGCDGGTPTNGLEDKSPAQIQEEAAAAIRGAKGVHVTGTSTTDGTPAQVDLQIQNGSSSGTITLEGARFKITRVDDVTYAKADEAPALESLGVPPEMHDLGTLRWLKLAPQEAPGLEGFSLDSFAQQLTMNESTLKTEVKQTELHGKRVVVISAQDGSRLYIANTGPAYPIRGDLKGANEGRIDFSEYGADFQITAPQDYVELSELTWLGAIKSLHAKIDESFRSGIVLTQAEMVSLAGALGECSLELARIGSPTERLQPVYELVAEACARYDEGAGCFGTAASVSDLSGSVIAGTPEEQTQTSALDCGFAAQGDGSNLLTMAEAKGTNEILNPAD